MAPRFAASKYRNALPTPPKKEEWYRTSLSQPTSSTSSALTTFTSEIKCNKDWIVTVSPGGDASWRKYGEYTAASSGKVGGGGGVGDWDLGSVWDGGWELVIGGLDGKITVYTLPAVSSPGASASEVKSTFQLTGPVTNLSLHPATPSVLLVSTPTSPLAIYDLSQPTPSLRIQLDLPNPEPKGLWSIAWSSDGKLVGCISRTGVFSVWDPRASTKPIASRSLMIQSLKPARIIFVGEQVFVTSTSKTRDRQYTLLESATSSNPLSTMFTQTIDQNTAPLLTALDSSRGIIYLSSKGDMILRQIEISGPQGFQETVHPLQQALTTSGLALAHPAELQVMVAEIGVVLYQGNDKDGEGLIGVGIRVPRRQLIDYHEDLFPEIEGFLPEQTSEEWFGGSDRRPIPLSLDPSKRGLWEKDFESRVAKSSSQHSAIAKEVPLAPNEAVEPTPVAFTSPSSSLTSTAPKPTMTPPSSAAISTAKDPTPSQQPNPDPSLPPLETGETYSSTSYKIRIVGEHVNSQLEIHRKSGTKAPLMVGLQGPQGCGKTTLCDALLGYLREEPRSLRVAVLSLDDLYRTNAGLKELAAKHPDNALLAGRGPPGTHDVELATSVLQAVASINEHVDQTVELPIFDKSLCGGEGDRSTETVSVQSPLDVFILEGWSMGFPSLPQSTIETLYTKAQTNPPTPRPYYLSHPLKSLIELNDYLSTFSEIYEPFKTIIQIQPDTYEHVFKWRLEQEKNMKASNGGRGMSDDGVRRFVERYMPGYEIWSGGVWGKGMPWDGRGLRVFFGAGREVTKVEQPSGMGKEARGDVSGSSGGSVTSASAQQAAPSAPSTSSQAATSTSPATASAPKTATIASSSTPSSTTATTVPLSQLSKQTPSVQTPNKPFNPTYSRKFLSAKSPLIPTHDLLPPISTLHQDSQILALTPTLAIFPIQGPGGRLVIHPLARKGRMDSGQLEWVGIGCEIVGFAVESFGFDLYGGEVEGRWVAVGGEDGLVKVWKVGRDGLRGAGREPNLILKGKGIDKILQVVFHPTAKDLLVVASSDQDKPHLHFFDLSSGVEVKVIAIDAAGIFNITFSPSGDTVAISTKSNQLLILDPRNPSQTISGPTHDSPRSFQVSWLSPTHLISVGFSRGSQRTLNLYHLLPETNTLKTISKITIDVSPAVLFPFYDPDTKILFIWGKGERQIQVYQVDLESLVEPLVKLPSYTSASPQIGVGFAGKKEVDVKRVEVLKGFRMTAKTLEEISFSIPRNKHEFFQDDVYVPTLDVERPSCDARSWLGGNNTPQGYVDLKPEGMKNLSEAPQTTTKSTKNLIASRDILSEEEKKRREMDRMFQKAKAEESSSDEDGGKGGLDPPDDDW